METVDNIKQAAKRKNSFEVLPTLKLERIDETCISTSSNIRSEVRVIAPYTPPRENPNAILKNKLVKRMSDELIKIQKF